MQTLNWNMDHIDWLQYHLSALYFLRLNSTKEARFET